MEIHTGKAGKYFQCRPCNVVEKIDGESTGGGRKASAKANRQLIENSPIKRSSATHLPINCLLRCSRRRKTNIRIKPKRLTSSLGLLRYKINGYAVLLGRERLSRNIADLLCGPYKFLCGKKYLLRQVYSSVITRYVVVNILPLTANSSSSKLVIPRLTSASPASI